MARDGSLWIGTNGGGLSRMRDGKFTNFSMRDGLTHDVVWRICEDHEGTIWIGTNRGLSKYRDGKIVKVTMIDDVDDVPVKTIYEDREGTLWIGTEGRGLVRYSRGRFTRPHAGAALYRGPVQSIFEDAEGSLWVGTAGAGLYQLLSGKFTMIGTPEGLVGNGVWALLEARDGSMWVGTNEGISRIRNGVMTNFTSGDGFPVRTIRSLAETKDGAIWFATFTGVGRFLDGKMTMYQTPEGLSLEIARCIIEDREGTIWIGTRGGGLNSVRDGAVKVYRKSGGFLDDVVWQVAEDRDGSLWIATSSGVTRLYRGSFTNYTEREGLSSNAARIILHDGADHWVGTYGGGLNRIRNGKIKAVRARDGLFDEVILSIVDDRRGSFWIGTNHGIFRVSKRELNDFCDGRIAAVHSDSYTSSDGMRSSECNSGSPASLRTADGRLWFSTLGGVAIIDPAKIARNNVPPPVWNENVLIDGKPAEISANELSIGPGKHSLEIHYTSLSFIGPKKVAFRYRLVGFDRDWVDAGNRRVAFYTNLSPGHYAFEVMGSNNDGVWRPAKNPLRLHFHAPSYQTWWFYTLVVIIVVVTTWWVHRFQLKLTRAEALVRTAELERSLAQSQKMESLGQMAAGIAHDFNNTMMTALPWADLVRKKYPEDPTLQKSMENIRSAVLRARDVTFQLLDFAQPKPPKTQPVDLADFLQQQLVILRPSVPPEIAIDVRVERRDLAVSADTTQLSQLIVNLALNARDAMPGGGRLRFEIREVTADDEAKWGCSRQDFVVFAVSDTGVGMDEQTRRRIFDPFFTTKDIGKGTGLGLAIVHRIVEQHLGSIFVDSSIDSGSTFYLLLPRVVMPFSGAEVPAKEQEAGRLAGLTIMLVDDEIQVCEGVQALLEMDEAEVAAVHRGTDAIRLLEKGFQPDLIVLDLGLPEMPGEAGL